MTDDKAGYSVYVGQNLPSDDVLADEGRRLMERVWKYGATGMSREALIFIARDLRTGQIVTRPEFLSGSNKKRRWKRRIFGSSFSPH